MIKNSIQFVISLALMVAVISLAVVMIYNSINSSEKNECNKWKVQSTQYVGFYLTQWQKDQCDVHDIIIDTLIK